METQGPEPIAARSGSGAPSGSAAEPASVVVPEPGFSDGGPATTPGSSGEPGLVAGPGSVPGDVRGLADWLTAAVPGPDLVGVLASLDGRQRDEEVLVEGIAGWERVIAWASARQTELVSALAGLEPSSRHLEFVGDMLACRLVVSRRAVEYKMGLAWTLEEHPRLRSLLAGGVVDVAKVRVIGEELVAVPEPEREAVLDIVIGRVGELTGPQIRTRLRKAVLATDPKAARRRARRERARRGVFLTPMPDAMARLIAYLPADAAMTCFTALDALAAAADPKDPREIEARRADALTDVLRAVLDSGVGPDGALPVQQGRRPHLQVTVAAGTLLGLDEEPAELAGY